MKNYFYKSSDIYIIIGLLLLFPFFCGFSYFSELPEYLFGGETRNAKGAFVGLIVTVIGIVCVVLGLNLNNKHVKEQTRQNNISEKAQINTRFKDAAMLLGSDQTSSILAGIYALHQIAVEASEDAVQKGYVKIIHDILCAFVRENSNVNMDEKNKLVVGGEFAKPTIVLQTIVDVLFKNNKDIYGEYMTKLDKGCFEGVDFKNAKIRNASFFRGYFKSSDFLNATITGTSFSGASLRFVFFDNSALTNVKFVNSRFSSRIMMKGAKLVGVDFWSSIFSGTSIFENSKLESLNFEGCNFTNSYVSFKGTVLEGYSLDEIIKKSKVLTSPDYVHDR